MRPDPEQAAAVQEPRGNLYAPITMTIADSRDETYDVRTLRLEFPGEAERAAFFKKYRVGMFGLYGVPGAGESVFCIASPPTRDRYIECTFRRAGRVTAALQDREVGQTITFRGPYGNSFPIEEWKGRNIVFVAGGIGLAPIRAVIWNILDRRDEFGDVTIIYGARTVADLVYKHELKEWQDRGDVRLITTVDPGGETDDWKGEIGFVPTVLEKVAPGSENAIALVCGPPIMIKFTLAPLRKLGFPDADAYTTLENRMKCGVGKCGRCNVGSLYVCKDGPVFTIEQVRKLPQDDL
ncbi:MAG: heterodisulfide reductase subunit F [Planctomycetes bacterium DG_20]|nr:MAG: heterodisulfide reductase subunit F [Planctomycetes bacterium DG_20]